MDIHQMQMSYDPRADRLLWNVRTRAGEMFAIWLTRRMALRLRSPFERLVTQTAMPQVPAARATVVPEAQALMSEMARQKPLQSTSFQAPFDSKAQSRPLGPEPLLPDNIDLTPTPQAAGRGLMIRVRETGGRSMQLQLNDELAMGLMRLFEQALKASEWNTPVVAAESTSSTVASATVKPPLAS
jgi:hypothetical protein